MPKLRALSAPLLCVLLLAGCSRGAEESAEQPRNQPETATAPGTDPARQKVVALGDSLTAGYGLVESQSYPALLQQKIDTDGYRVEIVNAGVSGDTSAGALRRLDWALEGDVRVLIVALGGNDGLRGLSVSDMKRNLEAIVEKARAKNILVILAGMEAPPNYGQEYATAFRMAFQDVARQQRVLFIPFLLDKVAGQPHLNLPDGIHPNAEGSAIVAETVWRALRPVLDQMSANQ